jgi:hypothetical protein
MIAVGARHRTLLAALLLMLVSVGAGSAGAQTIALVPAPYTALPQGSGPQPAVIYLKVPRPAGAPQPLVCAPHTKWRPDCTPWVAR